MFTASPIAVYCSARELPMAPVTTMPVLMPMPMLISFWPSSTRMRLNSDSTCIMSSAHCTALNSAFSMATGAPKRAITLVAHELVERALVLEDHVHHQLEVLVEHADDLLRRARLAHRGEAADVGEQQRHLGEGAALFELQLALHDLIDQVRRQQALELRARLGLLLDLAREPRVVDGDRRLAGDAAEDLQVLLDEGVGRDHRVEVHDAEQLVVVESGTVIVERMPCMMTECAAEKRLSIVASDDSTDALFCTTSLRIDFDSTICSFLPSRVLRDLRLRDAVLHAAG